VLSLLSTPEVLVASVLMIVSAMVKRRIGLRRPTCPICGVEKTACRCYRS
jgi:hypothetical protein